MYAPQHTVFIGPGKLPDELRQVLMKRAGAPQPDIAIQVPRLLALFETAAEAERVASQVQRLKLGVAVAGPEQPPAELSWTVGASVELFDQAWRVTTADSSEPVPLPLAATTAVTLLDWRPDEGAADRAVLLTLRDQKPVMLRASTLDTVSRHSVPIEGIRRLNELLDAAARVLPPETRIRSRRLAEADFRGEGKVLTGDLLPLVLAVVDAVDTLPGSLPQPLQGRAAPREVRPAHQTATAALAAWALYGLSLPALALALAYLTMASVTFSIPLGIAGLSVGGWATRRFMWSRWLARANWGGDAPVPSWPIADDERGIAPRGLELGLDVLALGSVAFTMLGDGLPHHVSLWALPFLGVGALASALSVYEAWQRE